MSPEPRNGQGVYVGYALPASIEEDETVSNSQNYGGFQNEIYLEGLQGKIPEYPVDHPDLVAKATAAMPSHVLHYVQGGCGDDHTQDRNARAFSEWGATSRRPHPGWRLTEQRGVLSDNVNVTTDGGLWRNANVGRVVRPAQRERARDFLGLEFLGDLFLCLSRMRRRR